MIYILREAGYEFTPDPEAADYLIINTCGFITAAKAEAISATLELADLKRPGAKLVMTGCLPQRYMAEIYRDLPEVDACLGTAEYKNIAQVLDALGQEQFEPCMRAPAPGSLAHLEQGRVADLSRAYAYLKVAEGCSNHCAFCAIPGIRGPLRSRPQASLVREARDLSKAGFQELILVAQDTARYGTDLKTGETLVTVLRALLEETEIPWIRLMYTYGDALSDEMIALMASEERILPYLDMPIQHVSDAILKRMGRHETKADIARNILRLRNSIPNLILRTTVLLGFPGEREDEVSELIDFIQEHPFDRLGCFAFSPEEKTRAYRLPGQIDDETKASRVERVMTVQADIAERQAKARLGQRVDVLLESVSPDGIFYVGRSYGEAPEIDPDIFLLNSRGEELRLGQRVRAEIIDVQGYDLTAKTV